MKPRYFLSMVGEAPCKDKAMKRKSNDDRDRDVNRIIEKDIGSRDLARAGARSWFKQDEMDEKLNSPS